MNRLTWVSLVALYAACSGTPPTAAGNGDTPPVAAPGGGAAPPATAAAADGGAPVAAENDGIAAPAPVDRPARLPASSGRVWQVANATDLQTALAGAAGGDQIVLAGDTDYGQLALPARPAGQDWIVIRGDRIGTADCPADGDRFDPVGFPSCRLPRFTSVGETTPGISTAEGAHHYWLAGIEVARSSEAGVVRRALAAIGNGVAATVHHVVLDRMFIHGSDSDAAAQTHSGLLARGGHIALLGSRVSAIQTQLTPGSSCSGGCTESQGVLITDGAGPYEIRNNYIAAATENIFIGGPDLPWAGAQDPVNNEMAKDLTIVGNHLHKPASWFALPYQPGGNNRLVKDNFELKAADRVRFESNYLENSWSSVDKDPAQAYPPGPGFGYAMGAAIVLTPRNQTNQTPYARISDVRIMNNRIINVQRGVALLGDDDLYPSGPLARVRIANNLFDGVPGNQPWSSVPQTTVDGILMTHVSGRTTGAVDLTFEHNTAFHRGAVLEAEHNGAAAPMVRFIFRDNLVHGGFAGGDGSVGAGMFQQFLGDATFDHNDLVGADPSQYGMCGQAMCLFSPSDAAVRFSPQTSGDYPVTSDSPDRLRCSHAGAHDIGAWDWQSLDAVQPDRHPDR
jgi:hypothetical protein